jgi:hypothetical protein
LPVQPDDRIGIWRRASAPGFGLAALVALVAAAALTAVALAAVTLAPQREERLLIGRPGDAAVVTSGMSLPSEYLGARGRWTRGDATVALPAHPARSTVSLRLAPPAGRAPDPIEVVVNGLQVHRVTLVDGWNDVAIRVPGAAGAPVMHIRSAVTMPAGGRTGNGVFVEGITVKTGGVDAVRHTPFRTWTLLSLAWLALFLFAWRLTARERDEDGRGAPLTAVVVLSVAAAIAFRSGLLAHLPAVTALCWMAAIGVTLAGSRAAARLGAAPAWQTALLFAAGAAIAFGLLFPEALFEGRVFSQADMFLEFAPWSSHVPADYRAHDRPPLGDIPMFVHPFFMFTQARWWAGVFPWWTSEISAGQPFLATYQSVLFSPFTAILAIVPLPRATVVIVAARLLVAGFGMFLFLRALRLSRWAAAFGGLAYLLNPVSIVWLEHPLAGVLPWLPWMLLAGERLTLTAHRAGSLALLAITTALVLMGGHPHGGLFVAALGSAYAIARACAAADRGRAIVTAVAALGLGAGLAAVQILPFLEYLSLSRAIARRSDFPLNPYFAPASTLITALVPNFLGHHSAGNFAGPTNYLEQQTYPGIAIWLLAAGGLASHARRWRAWFFAATALLAMLVMYAAPGVHQIVSSLPLIKAASLPRVAIITIASLTVLAAFGLDRILGNKDDEDEEGEPSGQGEKGEQGKKDGRRVASRLVLTMAVGATALSLSAIALGVLRQRAAFLDEHALLAFATRWTWMGVWLAAAVLLLAIARLRFRIGRAAAGFAFTAVLALDLLLVGHGFRDLVPPAQVFPMTPEIAAVQRDRGLFRVMGLGQAMLPNAAMAYGLQDVRGFDGLMVARYADLLDVVLRDQQALHTAEGVSSPLINLLNVKYVFGAPNLAPPDGWFTRITDGDTPVYRNNRVLPRAFLVDGYVVRDGNPARRTLRDGLVDFRRVALLEQDLPDADRPAPASSLEEVGAAVVTGYGDHQVEIETDAPGRRLLVLTDVHYPGWAVSIDGQPATLSRANFAFRAVPVPAGRHRIVFAYRPASVRAGLSLSALAGAALIGFVFYERRRAARAVRASRAGGAIATDPRLPSPVPPPGPAAR